MVAPIGLGVGGELEAFLVDLPGVAEVVGEALSEVVGVDELAPGVVRRVDVDQLDLAVVRLLQELEYLEGTELACFWRWARGVVDRVCDVGGEAVL